MIFDSHAHYDDKQFNADRDELLSELLQNGIGYVVNVGADTASTERSIALAKKYPFIYAAAGVHPSDVGELDEDENNFKKLRHGVPMKNVLLSEKSVWIITGIRTL